MTVGMTWQKQTEDKLIFTGGAERREGEKDAGICPVHEFDVADIHQHFQERCRVVDEHEIKRHA